jgi:hypothetical protein
MKHLICIFSICCASLSAWGQTVTELVEDVSVTNLETHVLEIVGPRWTEADMAVTASYIASELTSYGYTVTFQDVQDAGGVVRGQNVVARLQGSSASTNIVVIGAHLDTENNVVADPSDDTPGADDNASGIASLLELARILSNVQPTTSIEFVAFTMHESSWNLNINSGSIVYVADLVSRSITVDGMIKLGTIGYTTAIQPTVFFSDPPCSTITPEGVATGDFVAATANADSAPLAATFRANAATYVPGFPTVSGVFAGDADCFRRAQDSDHYRFWLQDWQAILVGDTGPFRNPNYHLPSDTADTLDYEFMGNVTRVTLATVLDVAGPHTSNRPQYSIGTATPLLNAAFYAGEASDGSNVAGRVAFHGFANADVTKIAFWGVDVAANEIAIFTVNVGDSSSWTRVSDEKVDNPAEPIYWLPDDSGLVTQQSKVVFGNTAYQPYAPHAQVRSGEGSLTRKASDNWLVDVGFDLGQANIVAIPINNDGTADTGRSPVYITNFNELFLREMDWPAITPDATSVTWSEYHGTSLGYDEADVYTLKNVDAILAAPVVGNVSTLAPTSFHDDDLTVIRENDQFATTPFFSQDQSTVFWTEDWNRKFLRSNFFATLALSDFDSMLRNANGIALPFRIAETGNQGTVVPTAGGTRLTYISDTGAAGLNLYMTTLTVTTPALGNTVGAPADNDIVTTDDQLAEDTSGTTVDIATGTTIDFPAGEDQEITIQTPIDPVTAPQLPNGVNGIAAVRTFGPAGTTFSPAVEITITYTDAEIVGMTESTLNVFLFNSTTMQYDTQVDAGDIVSRDLVNNTITYKTTHFSTYGVGDGSIDTTPPVITLNGNDPINLECGVDTYIEPGAIANDDVDGSVPVTMGGDIVDPDTPGTYIVIYSAMDSAGNTAETERTVNVADTTAPALSVTTNPDVLWPPNHNLHLITPTISVSDACDDSPTVELVNVTVNEGDSEDTFDPVYDTEIDDGKKADDVQFDTAGDIYLRAERKGNGNGRMYTLHYEATDAAGNVATATATVTVPHNQ